MTKRLHYLFNIWPFSTAKNYPIALKIAKLVSKIFQMLNESSPKWQMILRGKSGHTEYNSCISMSTTGLSEGSLFG